jgi:hypothetical protein
VTSVRRQPVPTQPTTTTIKPPKPTLSPTTATATTKIAITEEVGHDRIPPTARKVEDATVVDSGNSTESTTRPNVDDNDNEDLTFSLIGGGVGAVLSRFAVRHHFFGCLATTKPTSSRHEIEWAHLDYQ